jgi:hypothetical protein
LFYSHHEPGRRPAHIALAGAAQHADGSMDSEGMRRETVMIEWLKDVVDHDFEAAYNYLSLRLDADRAKVAVKALKKTEVTTRRANDILRACGYTALPLTDPGVHKDLLKSGHTKLSPILVVSFAHGGEIADGYHRVSLAYNIDPFADVPLRIAHVPELEHGK